MPRPKAEAPLLKVKINLFAEDYERLKIMYPQQGPARVIRALVRRHVTKIDRAARVSIAAIEEDDIEIELTEDDLSD